MAQKGIKPLGQEKLDQNPGNQITQKYWTEKRDQEINQTMVQPKVVKSQTKDEDRNENITNEGTQTKTETSKLMIKYDKNDG